ncbi:MAG: DUF2917 domain-containing protein [Rariglobus sp.]
MTGLLDLPPISTRLLATGKLVRRDVADRLEVHCTRGRLWITVDNSREDIVLEAGERHEVTGPTLMVIEALTPAEVVLDDEAPRGLFTDAA